jgi:hypothetical protein
MGMESKEEKYEQYFLSDVFTSKEFLFTLGGSLKVNLIIKLVF